jgi:hypothetical protein
MLPYLYARPFDRKGEHTMLTRTEAMEQILAAKQQKD